MTTLSMAVDVNSEDALRIRKLVPLATLPGPLFNELCGEMTVEEVMNAPLFKKGDTDNHLFYLIEGEVVLQSEGLVIEVISSAHESSRFALAHQLPRKIDAVAKGAVRFLRVAAERINNAQPLDYKEENEIMVVEEDQIESSPDDWMTVFLKMPIFQNLPPANLQKVLMGLEEIAVEKGGMVIEQGAPGDYYYFLKSGRCLVSRKPSPLSKEIRLGVLEKGDTFGEDALIADAPRTVSITALTDVILLRLDKKQFVSLIKTPSLTSIDYEELLRLRQDGALVLDIRPPDEFEKHHLEGGINIPFFSLRMQFKNLSRDKTLIVVCRDGRTSEAGAFFLLKNRYKAVILKGGMQSLPEDATFAEAPCESGGGMQTVADASFRAEQEAGFGLGQTDSPEERLCRLEAENEALRQTVSRLTEKCHQLSGEKKRIEERFVMLSRHYEQLKQIAQKLKGSG